MLRTSGLTLTAVAVALAVGSGYYARRAASDADDISSLLRQGGAWDAHAADVDADGRRSTEMAKTLIVMAAVTGAVGLGAYLIGRLR